MFSQDIIIVVLSAMEHRNSVNSESSGKFMAESYMKDKHTALGGIKPQIAREHREITSKHIYSVILSSMRFH